MKQDLQLSSIPCPLCGADDYEILFRDKNRRELIEIETNTVKCKACGMVYLSPLPDSDEFLQYYERIYVDSHASNKKQPVPNRFSRYLTGALTLVFSRMRRLSRRIFPICDHRADVYKEQSAAFLDIGCGHGGKLRPFIEKGYEVWGIDANPAAISDARENLPSARLYVGTMETVELPKRYFDYIQLDSVFEHIYEPLKFLTNLRLYLKEDGQILLDIPSISTWQFLLLGRFYSQNWIPFHINLFSKKTIRKMAEKAGYTVKHLYPVSDPWWVSLSIRQLLHWQRKQPITFKQNHWTELAFAILQPICWFLTYLGNADSLVVVLSRNRETDNA